MLGGFLLLIHSSLLIYSYFSIHESVLVGCMFLRIYPLFFGYPICWFIIGHNNYNSSVQSLCYVWLFLTPGLQHTRLPCPSTTPGAYSNSCSPSWWHHPTIPSSVVPFSSRLQSFPASESFSLSQFFASGGQIIRVSASTSVFPMNTQLWSPLGWTGWISLQSKGLSIVFSNTPV